METNNYAAEAVKKFYSDYDCYNYNGIFNDILKHELKTPAKSHIVMLELLLREKFGKLNEVQKEILSNLISSSEYSLMTIKNVILYNDIKKYGISLSKEKHNIKLLIEEAVLRAEYILLNKTQKIYVKAESDDLFCKIDVDEIRKVLFNLIANLSEMSDKSSENIIFAGRRDKYVKISFINKTYKTSYLSKSESSFKKRFKKNSFDLNLNICSEIIRAHKGTFDINPFKNSNYVFCLRLNTQI